MMTNLPEKVNQLQKYFGYKVSKNIFQVSEDDIEEMFTFADKDKDGKISFMEFQMMINPPKLESEILQSKNKDPVKKVTILTSEEKES